MNQHFYNTLAELKNSSHLLQNGDYCETLGYYAVMDGGKAKYLIKQDSNSIPDGGYIIRLSNTLIAILIIENNEINALQYGAHKDWTQYPNEPSLEIWELYDNREIFHRLMLKAKELSCNVYIPAGIYMCIPTKTEDTLLTMYSNITLRGDGINTVITLPTIDESIPQPYYSPILKCLSISNFTVKDIAFDGNRHLKPDGTYFGGNDIFGVFGVEIMSNHNATFENVTCQNSMYVGFRIWDTQKLSFNRCSCLNVDCGFITVGEYNISDLTINNCYIDGHIKSEGISLFHCGIGKNIAITNNIIKNKENGIGILVGNQQNVPTLTASWNDTVIISDNIIENCAVGIHACYASHVNIANNIIENSLYGDNLYMIHCSDCIISNNQFYYSCNDNIYLSDSKHILINGNIIKDNSPTRQEYTISFGFMHLLRNSCISIRNNQIYQELTSIKKCIRINESNNGIIFESNDINHDYRDDVVTNDIPTTVWIDGSSETNCVKNSLIELPPNTSYYTSYPPTMDDNINHSNRVYRRIEEITNFFYNDNKDELARCCIIDVTEDVIDSIALKPINTRLLLIFLPNRSLNTELRVGGNVHFSEYGPIKKDIECVIEIVCLGSYWMEVSRTTHSIS